MSNGILELSPFMSALITEDAFLVGGDVLQNPEVYVLGKDGVIYQYHQFSLGRSAMMKIADTPIRTASKSVLEPRLNPLVNGKKIPMQFLTDILEFFKQVMAMTSSSGTGHGDYEAMAHIVWNTTTESYRVAIPKQKVAKASVSYDWDHVKGDEVVIFDIHSHNSMDAFFSGTDERDDSTYVGISAVAGRLNTAEPRLIFRFNAYKTKQAMVLEDVFEAPVKQESPVVAEWMKNVEVLAARPTGYAAVTGSRVYGGGLRLGVGLDRLDERNPREDSWDARFHNSIEKELTATGTQRSQASVDILGDDDSFGGLLGIGASWDETVDDLVASVYNEDDEEMNAAVAKRLGESIADTELLYQEGLFVVSTASEARKAVERLTKDFNIRSA